MKLKLAMTRLIGVVLQTLSGFAFILVAVPTLLLSVISIVDDNEVRTNLRLEAEQLTLPEHGSRQNSFGMYSDNYTDCITASMIVFGDPARSSLQKLADTDFIRSSEQDPCADLRKSAKQVVTTLPYPRYWHGSLLLSLPVLSVASFDTLRTAAAVISLISVVAFLHFVVVPSLGLLIGVSLLLMIGLTTDVLHVSGAFTHKLAVSALFSATTMVSLAAERRSGLLPFAVVVSAGLVVPFDLLVVTPLVPMYFASVILMQSPAASLVQSAGKLVIFMSLIVLTYLSLMAWRMLLFFEYGKDIGVGWFDTVTYFINTWSASSTSFSFSAREAGGAILKMFFEGHGAVAGLLLVGIAIVVSIYQMRVFLSPVWPFAFLAILMMIVWLILMPAHTAIHSSIIGGRWVPLMLIPLMLCCLRGGPQSNLRENSVRGVLQARVGRNI